MIPAAAAHAIARVCDAKLYDIPALGPGLLGDKSHSMIFDNRKVKGLVPEYVATVPFATGAREIIAWQDAEPGRGAVDDELNAAFDRLIAAAG